MAFTDKGGWCPHQSLCGGSGFQEIAWILLSFYYLGSSGINFIISHTMTYIYFVLCYDHWLIVFEVEFQSL